jgi:fido (protein-threonine AMPylation protein)
MATKSSSSTTNAPVRDFGAPLFGHGPVIRVPVREPNPALALSRFKQRSQALAAQRWARSKSAALSPARRMVGAMGRARGGQASRSSARRGVSAAVTVIAARATFAIFRDEPTSPFYCAEGMSPEQTWKAITEQVAVVTAEVVAQASECYVAVPRDVRLWHERIFGPWFPDEAGRQRVGEERSQFDVVWGTRDRPRTETIVSCKGSSVSKRLGEAFTALRQAIEERDAAVANERQRKLGDATLPAAKFYAKLLSTHPFFDGNGRVAYVALQYALVRLGATGVALPDHDEQQWALGQALRRGGRHQNYVALAVLFEETIRASSVSGATI